MPQNHYNRHVQGNVLNSMASVTAALGPISGVPLRTVLNLEHAARRRAFR